MDVTPLLQAQLDRVAHLLPNLLVAVLVMGVTWLVATGVRRAVLHAMQRGRFTSTHRSFFAETARLTVLGIGLAGALDVVGLGGLSSGLLASGGITAVVLGFAFREIGENMLAGILLAFSRPFEVGDFVRSGDQEGKVVEINLRTTHLRTVDGRDVHVPNSQIVNSSLENFTMDGLRRPSFKVGIDYADDALAACALLQAVVAAEPDVLPSPPPQVVLDTFDGSWVTLEVSFWMDTTTTSTNLFGLRSRVMNACRLALRSERYTLSCDTTTAILVHPQSDLSVRLPAVSPAS